ncbi:hypothetical protein DFQ26_009799 [Actinomortierella ambigua]|nr:hypothetical protein DFQ26_009799 [Actinomortierella ambigua]
MLPPYHHQLQHLNHQQQQSLHLECTVLGGQCCDDISSIACQGWFCISNKCAVVPCAFCQEGDDPEWFCGAVQGANDPRDGGMACKRKAFVDQLCNNQTMPCQDGLFCSAANSTCQFLPEEYVKYKEQLEARRMTMIGMLVVLLIMFLAMRRMLKNEEARRRQIWEPVDSSAEASILRRLAEDTQRRLAGGWDQLNGSIVAGSNVASQAMGSALTRIRTATARTGMGGSGTGSRTAADDCEDVEMLPNGRNLQSRRELEDDMRAFMLEADDDEDEDLWDDEDDEGRDEDGLLARNRRPGSSNSASSSSSSSTNSQHRVGSAGANSRGAGVTLTSTLVPTATGYSDEPPSYDAVLGGEERRSMSSTLLGTAPVGSGVATTTTIPTATTSAGGPIDS